MQDADSRNSRQVDAEDALAFFAQRHRSGGDLSLICVTSARPTISTVYFRLWPPARREWFLNVAALPCFA